MNSRPHRLRKLARWLISVWLIATFLWKTLEAWNKYALGDTMIVSKVRQAKYQTFPTVTLCKGIYSLTPLKETEIEKMLEDNSKLDSWLYYSTFDDKYVWYMSYTNNCLSCISIFLFREVALTDWRFREVSKHTASDNTSYSVCNTFEPPTQILTGHDHRVQKTKQKYINWLSNWVLYVYFCVLACLCNDHGHIRCLHNNIT